MTFPTPDNIDAIMATALPEPRWYIALCVPQQEKDACASLKRLGYWIFYPFRRRPIGRRPHTRNQDYPLMPGYIFTCFRYTHETINEVENAWGVRSVLHTYPDGEKEYYEVPAILIDVLMQLTDELTDEETGEIIGHKVDEDRLEKHLGPHPKYHQIYREAKSYNFTGKPGDKLELIDEAPFYKLMADLESIAGLDKSGKLKVLLPYFGGKRPAEIPVEAVARIIAA